MPISTMFRNATNVVPVVEIPHSAVILRHMSASNYFCAGLVWAVDYDITQYPLSKVMSKTVCVRVN